MPSDPKSMLLTGLRVALVGASVGIAALTAFKLATMPPPPPESDGFAHGMAGLIGGILIISTLCIAAVGISLPTLLGRDDPLGFNRWQRLVLKASGVLIGGGLVAGLTHVFFAGFQYGIVRWLGLVVVASLAAVATFVWRLTAVLFRLAFRTVSRSSP